MLEYSHQTYKLTGHSTLADLVCLHTTQKWQGIKSTLLNSRKTTNLPSLPHMRISLSLWQQSFQSLGTSRIKSNIFWFQLVALSVSCLFLSFVFSARKTNIHPKPNRRQNNESLSVKKKQSPNRKSHNWSACIGKPLHRILPRSYLTFGTSHVDLPQVLKRRFKSKRLPGKTSKFEVLTIGVPAPRAPTGFEPKHCKKEWNTEVTKFRQKKKKRTRKTSCSLLHDRKWTLHPLMA